MKKFFMKTNIILEICLSPDLGGLELTVVDMFHYFKLKTPTFIAVSQSGKLKKFIEDEQKKIILPKSKLFSLLKAKKLASYIDTHQIDILHFHWNKDMLVVVLAKLLSLRKPKIVQSRHMMMTRLKNDIYHRWLYKNIDTIHAVTEEVQYQLQKFIPQDICPKLEMVYLGTKKPEINKTVLLSLREKYNADNNFFIGIVGRIEEGKGQYLAIEALSLLKYLKNIKLLIIGSAMKKSYLEDLKKQVLKLNLEDQVVFIDFSKNIDSYMHIFDIFILATKKETFGLVLLEAMMSKTAVLATNKGGPTEIINDGVDGLLFERNKEDLAKKIELLYLDSEYRNSIANKGYEKVQKMFQREKQLEKLYKVVVNEN